MCSKRKTKDINVKVFNIITSKNKVKTMVKHISCSCKCKFISAICNQIKDGIIKHANLNSKFIVSAKTL